MFFSGNRYRHEACLDMDLEISSVRYRGLSYIVADVIYLNRNWEQGNFVIDKEKNVRIYHADLPRWKRLK